MERPNSCRFANLFVLSTGELNFLVSWCHSRAATFPHFAKWLCELTVQELGRRQEGESEPGQLELPADMHGAELSDFLLGSYCLSRQPCTQEVGEWVDLVLVQAISSAAGVLESMSQEIAIP